MYLCTVNNASTICAASVRERSRYSQQECLRNNFFLAANIGELALYIVTAMSDERVTRRLLCQLHAQEDLATPASSKLAFWFCHSCHGHLDSLRELLSIHESLSTMRASSTILSHALPHAKTKLRYRTAAPTCSVNEDDRPTTALHAHNGLS